MKGKGKYTFQEKTPEAGAKITIYWPSGSECDAVFDTFDVSQEEQDNMPTWTYTRMKLSLSLIATKLRLKIRNEISYTPKELFEDKDVVVDYDIKLSNGKSLQRNFVWSLEQKRELIMSILKGIKLPRFAATHYKPNIVSDNGISLWIFKIVDGKQRLSTIESFMKNEFSIVINDIEYFYSDFDHRATEKIWNLDLRFDIVYEYDDTRITDDQFIEWFGLVNWAGTPQDKNHYDELKKSLPEKIKPCAGRTELTDEVKRWWADRNESERYMIKNKYPNGSDFYENDQVLHIYTEENK